MFYSNINLKKNSNFKSAQKYCRLFISLTFSVVENMKDVSCEKCSRGKGMCDRQCVVERNNLKKER